MERPTVGLTHCPLESDDAAVIAAVRTTVEHAGGVPAKLRQARTILVKVNHVGANSRETPDGIKRHRGRFTSCTEPAVTEGTIALLRDANPSAEILIAEGVDIRAGRTNEDVFSWLRTTPLVERYGVRLLSANDGEIVEVPVPGGGLIHKAIYLNREIAAADAVVSVAKLKCHGTAGISLSVKNMFGLLPRVRYGARNRFFMHTNYMRLMRIVVDVATTRKPDLAVIDGLVASNIDYDAEPLETNLLLAGHDPVATDAVGALVMGFDPMADFPDTPFIVAENHLRLAERAGLGVLDPTRTDVRGAAIADLRRQFQVVAEMGITTEQAAAARRAVPKEVAAYRARLAELLERHAGQFIYMRDGEVKWAEPTLADATNRAIQHVKVGEFGLAIQVLPPGQHLERFEAYEAMSS